MSLAALGAVEKLTGSHDTSQFDCGKDSLNRFPRRFALANQRANSARTYVVCRDQRIVVGYYSLAVGAVEYSTTPSRVSKGLARHPVPVKLLARLAIDRAAQRRGIGRALLKDALLRTGQAAEIAGIRALLVHAKDDEVRQWYEQFDFESSPTDPYHLFLLVKDLKAWI